MGVLFAFFAKIQADAVTADKLAANSVTASNGAIANLAVSTLKIQDNAVTVPVSASASAQYNLYSTYADILSATIASSGQPIYVLGHAVFYASSSSTSSQAWVEIEVYRNGTFVWRAGKDRCSVVHWGDDHDIIREGTLALSFVDTPSAGTYTYTAKARALTDTIARVYHRTLLLLETKK